MRRIFYLSGGISAAQFIGHRQIGIRALFVRKGSTDVRTQPIPKFRLAHRANQCFREIEGIPDLEVQSVHAVPDLFRHSADASANHRLAIRKSFLNHHR